MFKISDFGKAYVISNAGEAQGGICLWPVASHQQIPPSATRAFGMTDGLSIRIEKILKRPSGLKFLQQDLSIACSVLSPSYAGIAIEFKPIRVGSIAQDRTKHSQWVMPMPDREHE